ncbi:H+-translocating PPase (vacuolar) [Galdieria sulphuraria]|uniref:H(+)-exporting diphosphatase n=1 Tax=Galdieria sulphuraria TaxID=130081 RepID=M2W5M5_GALSU|nr:H+-translocating PPase (vacuolar) [Galdieria sulphuraria]EME31086.1 H+-translocating PPase (vacuolar) [Galdieria sulphuraria]|eukprot:XP_005707606.1 H+-translocating PPase (vacuolar) [Galdieria sulphuraria]
MRLTGDSKTLLPTILRNRPHRKRRKQLSTPTNLRIFIGALGCTLFFSCLALPTEIRVAAFVLCTVAFGGFLFSLFLAKWVLMQEEGTEDMRVVSDAIRMGADGFLRTQYGTIIQLTIFCMLLLFVIYLFRQVPEHSPVGSLSLACTTAISFFMGAICSGTAGFVGMWVSVRSNVRVASAASKDCHLAISIALSAGAFSAILVVSMCLLGIFILFTSVSFILKIPFYRIPMLLVGYGFGASFVALFAQLGGGIYTKAADVGADIIGKVETSIPEDDPRNPAVIADLVGDNVGDCAGRGSDLFESIAAEIISAMIIGGVLMEQAQVGAGYLLFPLSVHAMDLLVSSFGILSVQRGDNWAYLVSILSRLSCYFYRDFSSEHNETFENGNSQTSENNPFALLMKGYRISAIISGILIIFLCRCLLYHEAAPHACWYFCLCAFIGLGTGYIFIAITHYYTDCSHSPVVYIAKSSMTGAGTNVIAGISVGLQSTLLPAVTITLAVLMSYRIGQASGLYDSNGEPVGGLFGTAVATMGMLSTAAYILSMDVFGPIADNAGGIVEMSASTSDVRNITDQLDAVGNTTKAITKGYAVGTAALASFLLFTAFLDEVMEYSGLPLEIVDIAVPEVFFAGFIGASLVFLFSGTTIRAVGSAAQDVVAEVRRQFTNFPGIMNGTQKPDYQACVSIVTKAALREMLIPGTVTVLSPAFVGYLFKFVGTHEDDPLIGAKCVASFLMFSTATGLLLALFFNTGGGAFDNAKKLIERGFYGGKGSDTHKAAVTGDTLGDPFKDTAGPSLHVLIKLISTIALVLAPSFVKGGKT